MANAQHIYTGEGAPSDIPVGSGHTIGSQVHYTDTDSDQPWLGVVAPGGDGELYFDWRKAAPTPPKNGVVVSSVPKPEFEGQIGYDKLPNASIMYVGVTRLIGGSGGPPVTRLQWRSVATLGEWLEG